ncbi:flippase [Candidatus Daviesbacteria bacterium]|nr:flippase [Candidatus Daviesbacteria bacterium]
MFLKIFQQTSWQIFGKAVTVISTFIILGTITRNYGEVGTGVITLALTYINMFFLLADFGLNAHIQRTMEHLDKDQQEQIFRKLLGTRLLWACALVVLSMILLPFFKFASGQFSVLVIFGSLAIVGSAVFLTANLIFQRKFRYDLSILASIAGTFIYLGLVLWFARFRLPLYFLILAQTINWILTAVIALIFIRKFFRTITPCFDGSFILKEVKSAWPIGITLILNVIYFRADSFIIAYFRSVSESGIYNVAFQFFQSVLVLPAFIMNAYYPMMLKSFKDIKIVGLGLFGAAFLGTLITFMFSPVILSVLTGGGFAGSSQSLQILSLGFPAFFLSALFMWIYVTRGMYKKLFIIYAFGLLVNLVLNFIFIPQYSFYAAATTTVISEYLILLLLVVSLFL